MARVTVEDCLEKVENRFSLVHLAAQRAKQLKKGKRSTVICDNREIVTALREIANGSVGRLTPETSELALQNAEEENNQPEQTEPHNG